MKPNNPHSLPTLTALMTTDVKPVQATWSLTQLIEFFADYHLSGAPVVDHNEVFIGVVSATDIIRHRSFYPQSDPSVSDTAAFPPTVMDIMTPRIFEVDENTPLPEVADMMIRGHIHRLFVTRERKVIGIISALDLLKVIRDL